LVVFVAGVHNFVAGVRVVEFGSNEYYHVFE